MKKLMFAITAIAAGVCMADVSSANCVGYMNFKTKDTLNAGFPDFLTAVGLPFGAIGTMGGTVIDKKIFDYDIVENDKVVIYNPEVMDYEFYTFLGFDGDASKGWNFLHYNMDTWEQEAIKCQSFTVDYTEGVMMLPVSGEELSVNSSGQVADLEELQTWEMTPDEWTKAIMNPYPIATTFADLETFAKENDKLYVVNCAVQDCEVYTFLGAGNGWSFLYYGDDWEQHTTKITDSSAIVLSAGQIGYYVPVDTNGRVWTVTLKK